MIGRIRKDKEQAVLQKTASFFEECGKTGDVDRLKRQLHYVNFHHKAELLSLLFYGSKKEKRGFK